MIARAEELAAGLEAAILRGNASEIAAISQTIEAYAFDVGVFPDDLFELLISAIQSKAFAQLEDGVALLKVFEYNLDLLKGAQKEVLVHALRQSIPQMRDAIAAFLAVELIVEVSSDENALRTMTSLVDEGVLDTTLAIAAHGFDWLAKRTERDSVRRRALEELSNLAEHSSSLVRAEALHALKRRRNE